MSYCLDGREANSSVFVGLLPRLADHSGASLFCPLENGVQILDAESNVFDAVAVARQMSAHFRVAVGLVERFKHEVDLMVKFARISHLLGQNKMRGSLLCLAGRRERQLFAIPFRALGNRSE